MSNEEQQLLAQLNDADVPRSTAFGNIHGYLTQRTCWFCKHYELASCLLEVFQYQHNPTVQQIWATLEQQLAACTECINGLHTAQAALFDEFESTRPLLEVLWQLDKQRLLAWAALLPQQQQQPQADAGDMLSTQQLHALFELLGYSHYLDDAELCAAAVGLLHHVSWALETSEGTPYAGLLRLLAHPDSHVRSQALSVVKPMGPLDNIEVAGHTLSEVLDCWLTALHQHQQQQQQPQAPVGQLSYAAQHQLLVEPGRQQQWQRPCVWSALKTVMGMLQGECMTAAVELYPAVLPTVLAQATPGAYATAAAGGNASGAQAPLLAGAPYGPWLAPEGSLEQKHALGCLHSLLVGLQHELWTLSTAPPSPQQLVAQLESSVWAAVRLGDTHLLRVLLQVLQALAQSLLPCLRDGADDVLELWQDSDEEQQELTAAAGAAGGLVGDESKPAVLGCLRLLLVQLPGSAQVPLLVRGLALEAGLAVCVSALQAPRCPGTAVFAHLWAPVVAALLAVPQDQYSSLQGGALQQHQAPGIVQMLPVLRQMADLQDRITDAAAELVATALQADAAVLHATLSKQASNAAANKPWLLPSALDVVELSLNNSLTYKCAPCMWLTLAGCGHPVVSASFIAAAAQLVPLSSAAASAATRLQVVYASAQQQLESSLQLPDPERVDLASTAHAVYAVDCAGWLHQQFTRAAVRHMHICSCRSRLFLLQPGPLTPAKSPGGQQQIDTMFRQHATGRSPPPDSTAAAAYALAVRGCCTLMVQGKAGPAAVLAAEAEHALVSSCGVPLGQVQQAVQQHLLAPGSVCADGVVHTLQLELQSLLEHSKIARVFLKAPEQLASFFNLSGCALGAATSHGLDGMLPLFAGFLPGLWQLILDALSAGVKLLTSATACAACSSSSQLPDQQQQQGQHTGPGVGSVLRALLDALPAAWQCHQALITQRCEQRQLYLDAADGDEEQLLLSPTSQPLGGTPRQGTAMAVAAELHRQSGWQAQLLGLGQHLHAAAASRTPGGCGCIRAAAGDRHLRLAWRACLEDVVKTTRSSLPKAVKAVATELMQSDEPSLDKIWLAQLFPSAAPGNLASSGVGRWPSRLHAAGPTSPPPVAAAAAATAAAGAAAAATAAGWPASAPGAIVGGVGVSRQTSIDLADYDVIELLGEWSEDGSEGQPPDEGQAGSDSDVIIVGSSSEGDEPELQHEQLEQEEEEEKQVLLPSGTQRPQGSQAWPWLRKPATQQQQQQQVQPAQPDAVLQQQQEVKKAVSRLLRSSKPLHPSPQQRHLQEQDAAAAATQQLLSKQLPPSLSAGRGSERGATAAAEGPPAAAGKGSNHLLRFTRDSKTTTAAAAAGEHQQPAAPVPRATKRVKHPAGSSSAAALHGQDEEKQQQGVGSREGSADADVGSLWPAEWKDVKGMHVPEPFPVNRFNRPPLRPRKPAAAPAGLSKGEQARMELLGRGPAADSDAEEAALAAELIAAAVVSHGRRGASTAGRQHQHEQQGQGQDRNSSRLGSGRHDGVSAAGRAALHRAAAALVQQQRQAQEPELLLQRMQQRRQEEQQQALLRQQQQQAREERRKQLEAARAAEAAAAASAQKQSKQQLAAGRAGIALVSDDALFKQAAAAAAAAHRPRPAQPVRTITSVRHQGPLFLRSSRGPPAMGFGAPRATAPARRYPVLRVEDVWAELLSWGYQDAVGSSGQGGSTAAAAAAAATRRLLEEGRVPLRFTSVGHYCAVFRGLLLEELRAGLAAAHEEHVAGSTSSSNSASNSRGGGFKSMPLVVDSVQRQSKVFVVTAHVDTSGLQPRERDSPRSEDFVLLTRVQLGSGADLSEERLPRSHLSALVVEASNLQMGLRQITLHVAPAAGGSQAMTAFWQDQLRPGNPLWVTVISSLVPNFREFQALIAMQHAPPGDRLLRHVLHPEPPRAAAAGVDPDSNASAQQLAQLPGSLREALQSSYNSSQCAAVSACLDKRLPIVLVQGPPGTGKTAAIIGMLSALLGAGGVGRMQGATGRGAAKQGRASAAAAAAAAAGAGSSLPAHAAQSALKLGVIPPVRVLVCAQSNAAIDELIIRLANTGVWCGSGSRRAPAMVRMGRSDAMQSSILMFHVDALADAAVQQQAQERARAAAEAVDAGQQQLQQQQQPGIARGKAASVVGGTAGHAALESKVQQLRDRLRQVEQQLAALDKPAAAAAAADSTAGALLAASAPSLQPQQPGDTGRKRGAADRGAEVAVIGGALPARRSKLSRTVQAADVAAARTAVEQQPGSSGSDMDVSDGEGADAGRGRQTAAGSRPSRRDSSASPLRQHHTSGSSRRQRGSSRSKSPGRQRRSSSREPHSRSRHSRSSSRSPGRGARSRRSRSRSSGSRSPARGRRGDSSSSRARTDERSRGSKEHRGPGSSRKRSRSRSRSRSRDRGRGREGSNRAADRDHAAHDSRRSSRDSDRDRDTGRGRRSSSSAADPHGDARFDCRDRSRDADGLSRDSRQLEQGRGSRRHRSSSRDRQGSAAGGWCQRAAAAAAADGDRGRDRQTQQQQQHPATSAALLRDEQRGLLASLRQVERELQQAEGAAVHTAADRRELDRARRGARQAVIQAAEVVLCTLSASGGDLLNAFPPGAAPLFDVVVVDEAAQALEPATLIPFQLIKPGSGRVVLVGDPCQLPPTVLSKAAEASMLAQSLFERLARAGWPVQLLQEQYRSHPAISAFPSRFFYQGKLLDGAGINAVSKGAPFHSKLAFGPMVVWDCQEGRERGGGARGGGSLQNPAEAELAATLVAGVLSEHRSSVGSIAVISPYRAQVACLRAEFRRQLGGDAALAAANIEFGTVDGFQGREADVVVFSCVRAQPEAAATAGAGSSSGGSGAGGPRIGFLQDVRRMNVGLTRGRRAMWVVCHADTLTASPAWRPLLQEARARGVLLAARYPFRRLLTAGDRQLRGSYWTPQAAALPAPADTDGAPALPAAAAAAAAPLATGRELAGAGPQAGVSAAVAAAATAGAAAAAAAAPQVGAPAAAAGRSAANTAAGASSAALRPGSTSGNGQQLTGAATPAAARVTAGAVRKSAGRPVVGAHSNPGATPATAGKANARGGTTGAAGQQAPRQQQQQQQQGQAGPAVGLARKSRAVSSSSGASQAAAMIQGRSKSVAAATTAAAAAAAAEARPRQNKPAVGADAEAAAWAAAEAARAAAAAGPAAGDKAARAAAAPGVQQALLKRVQQQQAQSAQRGPGRAGGAAAAEGRPLADVAKSSARRTVLRPGQQTPAARPQPAAAPSRPPQQQLQKVQQRPAASGQGVAPPRQQAARGSQPPKRSTPVSSRPAPQQQDPQAELRAALLARLQRQQGRK